MSSTACKTTRSRRGITRHGTRAIVLAIQRQPGANTVEVVDNIKRMLPQFSEQIPAAVKLDILFDRSQSIRNVRGGCGTHSVSGRVPRRAGHFYFPAKLVGDDYSEPGAADVHHRHFRRDGLLGYSLDNLSLMALTLCVGFVVDDAIVMLENIVRHMENGEPPMEAAFNGSKEIGFTIISMTLSLSAVFIPVLFMSGLLGRLLHEFAVTIVVRGAGVRFCFADADADDVQPVCPSGARTKTRAALQFLRAFL